MRMTLAEAQASVEEMLQHLDTSTLQARRWKEALEFLLEWAARYEDLRA